MVDQPAPRAGKGRFRVTLMVALAGLLLWSGLASLTAIDVTEHGVVTRFGAVVRLIEEPGLHVKLPFDRIIRLDRRLLYAKPPQAEYLTADKKNVVVQSLATWRIADPTRFLQALGTRANAEVRLADIIQAETGAALGRYPFDSLIASDARQTRFPALVADVQAAVEAFAGPAFGIEVVDVDLRQLFLPEQNKVSVFERMKAERGRIAKQHRSEGERDSAQMIAEAEREKTGIMAAAHKEAAEITAQGEAASIAIYAEAYVRDVSFYKFWRTLAAYEHVLDGQTTLFLPADAELFRMLQFEGELALPQEPPSVPPQGRPDKFAREAAPATDGQNDATSSEPPPLELSGDDRASGRKRRK